MPRFTRTETITHDLGPDGLLTLRTLSGDAHVRTVDGTNVTVVATYEVHGRDDAAREIPPEASPINVRKAPGELEVETRNRTGGFLDALGDVASRGGRTTVDWDVELPRGASLRLHGVSADLSVDGVRGAQEYHTVSGDIAIRDTAGRISINSVSGDVSIVGAHGIAIDGTTTSGDVDVQAERFGRFRFTTVSGDVELDGALEPGDDFRIETVTGDLHLITPSGVDVEASGPAVSIRADVPHRADRGRGRRTVTIGDGSARVRFRSMSGDVTVSAPFASDRAGAARRSEAGARIAERISGLAEHVGRRAELAGRQAETLGKRVEHLGRRLEKTMASSWDIDADARRHAGDQDGDAETTRTQDVAAMPQQAPVRDDEPVDQMEVLRALERGEIDVAEATRLLSPEGGARHG